MRQWLLAALLAPPARAALSCVDEDGTPVDWWFLYKQPAGRKVPGAALVPVHLLPRLHLRARRQHRRVRRERVWVLRLRFPPLRLPGLQDAWWGGDGGCARRGVN